MSTAETQRPAKVYLGDSVYARIDNGTLVLTTENGLPRVPRNVIGHGDLEKLLDEVTFHRSLIHCA